MVWQVCWTVSRHQLIMSKQVGCNTIYKKILLLIPWKISGLIFSGHYCYCLPWLPQEYTQGCMHVSYKFEVKNQKSIAMPLVLTFVFVIFVLFLASNPDIVDKLEGLIALWSKEIEQVLAESEQVCILSISSLPLTYPSHSFILPISSHPSHEHHITPIHLSIPSIPSHPSIHHFIMLYQRIVIGLSCIFFCYWISKVSYCCLLLSYRWGKKLMTSDQWLSLITGRKEWPSLMCK